MKRKTEFQIMPGSNTYSLPDSFVLLNSEVVEVSGSRIDTSLYRMDYVGGSVRLLDSLDGNVRVCYEVFPFSLRREYCHRKGVVSPADGAVTQEADNMPGKEIAIPASPYGQAQSEGVRIGGMKTLSVSVGSKNDLSLNQSLELKIGGEVSGVAVSGVLSDKDSDLSEGGTKSLEELDDIYMEVETDQFKCRVGDCDFVMDGSRFCQFERSIEGVMATLSLNGFSTVAAGAVTRREFASNRFTGEDGRQGPYRLKDSKGSGCSDVVRGSEKVYLDGELLKRGEARDYTIDYQLGAIEFTSCRLITSESRIIVDFEFSGDEFRKSIYGAEVSTEVANGKLNLVASLFTERDDIETVLHSSLSERMKEELSRAGSDTVELWIDGGEQSGEDGGDYLKVDDHYEYVGDHSGNYQVSFTYLGEGKGDYVYDQKVGGYRWVGEGVGSYVARIRVSLPENRSLYDLKLVYYPISDLSVEYEHAFSQRDVNTCSVLDDTRNSEAHSLEVGLQKKPVGWGELTLSTRLWGVEEGFTLSSSVGRADKWYDQTHLMGCKAEEIEAVYSLPLFKIGISLGDIRFPEGKSSRRQVQTTVNPSGSTQAFLDYENVVHREREGVRFRNRRAIGLSHELRYLSPSLLYSQELTDTEKSRKYGFAVNLVKINRLSGRYEHTTISRDRTDSTDHWTLESREFRNSLKLSLDTRHTQAEFSCTHRSKKYERLPGENLDYSLFSLSVSSTPVENKVEIGLNSALTSKKSQRKEIVYTRVEEGEGDYIKDPQSGDYYAYDSGDYVREVVWMGDPEPALGLKVEFQSILRPNEILTLSSRFLTNKEVRKRNELLALSKGEKLRNVVDNSLEITSRNGKAGLRLSHCWRRSFEQLGEEKTEERRAVRANIRRGSRVDFVVGASEELNKNCFCTYVRREERNRKVEGTETFRFPPFTVSFLEGAESKRIRLPQYYGSYGWIGLNSLFVGPSLRFEIPFKGSLENRMKISFMTSPHEIPYILTITEPPGWAYEWATVLNYWLNESMSSTLIYQGEKRGGEPNHKFKAEIRGYF